MRLSGLQRTFSIFPGGWPGLGLLLLRASVAIGLFAYSYDLLVSKDYTPVALFLTILGIAIGLCLLLGYRTSVASVMTCLASASAALAWLPATDVTVRLSSLFTAIIAISILCLGPGAFSLDARRYGRREIIIPRRSDASLEE